MPVEDELQLHFREKLPPMSPLSPCSTSRSACQLHDDGPSCKNTGTSIGEMEPGVPCLFLGCTEENGGKGPRH